MVSSNCKAASGVLELIKTKDGWWYDLRTRRNSITPDSTSTSRTSAIRHARKTAQEFGVHISRIEDMAKIEDAA